MRRRNILGALLLFLLPIIMWVGLASAQTFRSGDVATVSAGETIDSSLFVSGRTVDISGTVNGDIFCAGMNVSISGKVRGDVICAGQTVTVSGTVDGDVRLAGQSVSIGGQITGSATVASSVFSLESSSTISNDLSVAGNDLVLNGTVGRDAALAGSTATIDSKIGRNVNANVENVQLLGQANIGGGLYYTSFNEAQINQTAKVAGETKRTQPAHSSNTLKKPFVISFGIVLYIIASLMILSLALVLLFPGAVHTATSSAIQNPLKILLVGFVASLAVPVLIVILMISVLGIPLALLLLVIWLLILFLSGPVFGYYIGRLIFNKHKNPFLIMAVGSFLVLLALFIPILGFVVWLAALWMGSGMLLLEFMRRSPRPDYDVS